MGGREVSRPYRVCFSPKASGFYPFGDAADLAGEGGVSDVVWLIQASASNHKPKGRFFWFDRNVCFMFQSPQYLSKESEFGRFWLKGVKFLNFMPKKYVI